MSDNKARGGRIKGADQGRQNVVFYRNTSLLTNVNNAVTNGTINFPTQIVDLKATVTNPASNWVFTAPRTRFYKISVWVEFTHYLLATATLAPPAIPFIPYTGTYSIITLRNSVNVSAQLVGQTGVIVIGAYQDTGSVSGGSYNYLSSQSAHAEGVIRLDAGDVVNFQHTYDFTSPGNGILFSATAKASVEIIEVTPEA